MTDDPGTAIATYAQPQVEQYQAALAMTPAQAKALDEQVRACTRAVLRDGVDFGVIPGTGDQKVLLKPGAEKLLQWFGFAYAMHCLDIERDDDGRKQGVTYRATVVKRLADGNVVNVATCEGYAGYDEAKFYKTAQQAQADAEAKERYWAKKDRRVANPTKWENVGEYRAPWNTIIKMAQKRALVGATIDATAAAGLFSQEEDHGPVADDGSTWYEQALEQALGFTTEADGSKLYVEAARAARDGLCTPKQADHVQNRVKIRLAKLKNATPVDVEDLGQPAAAGAGLTADPAGTSPDSDGSSAPGDDRHQKLVGAVQGHFKRLGFTDDDKADRLWAAAKLAGASEITSLNDLDPDELSMVAGALAKCRSRKQLEERLAAAGEGGGDG